MLLSRAVVCMRGLCQVKDPKRSFGQTKMDAKAAIPWGSLIKLSTIHPVMPQHQEYTITCAADMLKDTGIFFRSHCKAHLTKAVMMEPVTNRLATV